MKNPFIPEKKRVIYYHRETDDTFTIRLGWQLRHQPGQFVFCSLPGIGEAPISICSYSGDYVELNIREVGNVTKALSKIRKGSDLLVRGPYGVPYPMSEFEGKDIIIIGGGCGVAPLKGVIAYVETREKDYGRICLFFGFRSPEDVLFRKEISRWQKRFDISISFDKIAAKSCYGGKQGFVTQMVNEKITGPENAVALICGPPIMIEKTAEILTAKGFRENQIYISAERLMYCGIGKCGRCMIHGKYTCLDGAVFKYDELQGYKDD
ncbi:MAG: FAD/NAD(P)-binding protein [archaeon]